MANHVEVFAAICSGFRLFASESYSRTISYYCSMSDDVLRLRKIAAIFDPTSSTLAANYFGELASCSLFGWLLEFASRYWCWVDCYFRNLGQFLGHQCCLAFLDRHAPNY